MIDNVHVKDKAKNEILEEITKDSEKADSETKKILKILYNDFDSFISKGLTLNLDKNIQDNVIRPYIIKYHQKLKIIEEEFYKNPVKSIIKEEPIQIIKLPSLSQLNNFKQQASINIINKIKNEIQKNIDPKSHHKQLQMESKQHLVDFVNILEKYNNKTFTFEDSYEFFLKRVGWKDH